MPLQDFLWFGQSISHTKKMPRNSKISRPSTKGTSEHTKLSFAFVVLLKGSRKRELESLDGEIKQGKVDKNLDKRKKLVLFGKQQMYKITSKIVHFSRIVATM